MNTAFRTASLSDFLTTYEAALKASAPVRTGRLRDSITVPYPTLAQQLKIEVLAVDYAKYVNNKRHFVEANDHKVEAFATDFIEALWDDFFAENKTSKYQ